jgi:hypothetical protein
MSMQWESILAEACPSTCIPPPVSTIPAPTCTPSISPLPLLTDTEGTHLINMCGCWRCRKVPSDPGWVDHVSRNCPGDTMIGLSPGQDLSKSNVSLLASYLNQTRLIIPTLRTRAYAQLMMRLTLIKPPLPLSLVIVLPSLLFYYYSCPLGWFILMAFCFHLQVLFDWHR